MRRAMLFVCFAGIGLALSLLAGDALAGSIFDAKVTREYRLPVSTVVWIETDDIRQLCGPGMLACSLFDHGKPDCIIYTAPEPAFDILGHELMHCFTGRFHPQRQTQ